MPSIFQYIIFYLRYTVKQGIKRFVKQNTKRRKPFRKEPVTLSPQSGTQGHLNRPSKQATKRDIERYRGSKQTLVNVSNLLNFKKSA
jgi:hypothetical protein